MMPFNQNFDLNNLIPNNSMRPSIMWYIGSSFIASLLLSVAILFITSALLMWLWNITITRIFNIREITYWEAFRLMIIASLIFGKGFGLNFR